VTFFQTHLWWLLDLTETYLSIAAFWDLKAHPVAHLVVTAHALPVIMCCRLIVSLSPFGSFNIQCSFTCTSHNIVYAIVCMLCQKMYIGETGLRLGDRFAQHLRAVTEDLGWPVSNLFNLPGHRGSIDMRITEMVTCSFSDSDLFPLGKLPYSPFELQSASWHKHQTCLLLNTFHYPPLLLSSLSTSISDHIYLISLIYFLIHLPCTFTFLFSLLCTGNTNSIFLFHFHSQES
jgi:hypothetical protein